jgi:hypothetical protein
MQLQKGYRNRNFFEKNGSNKPGFHQHNKPLLLPRLCFINVMLLIKRGYKHRLWRDRITISRSRIL